MWARIAALGTIVCLACFLLAPGVGHASDPTPDPDARQVHPHLMLVAGASGVSNGTLHAFGGIELGARGGRWGGLALGQYGEGNGFESVLVAGGPSMRLLEAGPLVMKVHAGPAFYLERLDANYGRSVPAGYGALSVRIALSIGGIGVTFSAWAGRARGEGIVQATTVTGQRLSLGIGL